MNGTVFRLKNGGDETAKTRRESEPSIEWRRQYWLAGVEHQRHNAAGLALARPRKMALSTIHLHRCHGFECVPAKHAEL